MSTSFLFWLLLCAIVAVAADDPTTIIWGRAPWVCARARE
jgi:hypothetical protein